MSVIDKQKGRFELNKSNSLYTRTLSSACTFNYSMYYSDSHNQSGNSKQSHHWNKKYVPEKQRALTAKQYVSFDTKPVRKQLIQSRPSSKYHYVNLSNKSKNQSITKQQIKPQCPFKPRQQKINSQREAEQFKKYFKVQQSNPVIIQQKYLGGLQEIGNNFRVEDKAKQIHQKSFIRWIKPPQQLYQSIRKGESELQLKRLVCLQSKVHFDNDPQDRKLLNEKLFLKSAMQYGLVKKCHRAAFEIPQTRARPRTSKQKIKQQHGKIGSVVNLINKYF